MKSFTQYALSALSLLLSQTYAQTWTDCNPLNQTCPANTALGVANYTIDFTNSVMTPQVWNTTAGSVDYQDSGAQFIVAKKGDTPTVKSNFYIFFGQVEVIMKAATGQGIVSSIVMQSDDLDEVDWEWIGGNSSFVQSNYFGKGNTTSYDRAVWHPVSDPQSEWHNYTVDWSAEKLDWYIDSQLIRTLKYEDANEGHNFPQTPCDIRLGIWAGGDSANNNYTIEWAGGVTDYSKGPYTMTVKSLRVSDASRGTQYAYGDNTGSYQSIQITNTTTALKLDGTNSGSTTQSASQKWKSLSTGSKIAIGASVGGAVLLAVAIFAFCCIKQRRAGKHERLLEDAKFEKERTELLAYRAEMSRMRSEKMGLQNQQAAGGMGMMGPNNMGVAGVTLQPYQSQQQQQQHAGIPLMNRQYSAESVHSYDNGYVQTSIGSVGSGRGYQRY